MGQQKSKLYFDENSPNLNHGSIVQLRRGHESKEDRRKRKRWRKKQGFSLPIEQHQRLSAAQSHTDLPDLEDDDAILVSYSQSNAEQFSHLRQVYQNQRRASSEEPTGKQISSSLADIVTVHERPRNSHVQVIRVTNDDQDENIEATENFGDEEESEVESDWQAPSQSSFTRHPDGGDNLNSDQQKWKLSLEIPDGIKIAATNADKSGAAGYDEKDEPPIIVSKQGAGGANLGQRSPALNSLGREIFDELDSVQINVPDSARVTDVDEESEGSFVTITSSDSSNAETLTEEGDKIEKVLNDEDLDLLKSLMSENNGIFVNHPTVVLEELIPAIEETKRGAGGGDDVEQIAPPSPYAEAGNADPRSETATTSVQALETTTAQDDSECGRGAATLATNEIEEVTPTEDVQINHHKSDRTPSPATISLTDNQEKIVPPVPEEVSKILELKTAPNLFHVVHQDDTGGGDKHKVLKDLDESAVFIDAIDEGEGDEIESEANFSAIRPSIDCDVLGSIIEEERDDELYSTTTEEDANDDQEPEPVEVVQEAFVQKEQESVAEGTNNVETISSVGCDGDALPSPSPKELSSRLTTAINGQHDINKPEFAKEQCFNQKSATTNVEENTPVHDANEEAQTAVEEKIGEIAATSVIELIAHYDKKDNGKAAKSTQVEKEKGVEEVEYQRDAKVNDSKVFDDEQRGCINQVPDEPAKIDFTVGSRLAEEVEERKNGAKNPESSSTCSSSSSRNDITAANESLFERETDVDDDYAEHSSESHERVSDVDDTSHEELSSDAANYPEQEPSAKIVSKDEPEKDLYRSTLVTTCVDDSDDDSYDLKVPNESWSEQGQLPPSPPDILTYRPQPVGASSDSPSSSRTLSTSSSSKGDANTEDPYEYDSLEDVAVTDEVEVKHPVITKQKQKRCLPQIPPDHHLQQQRAYEILRQHLTQPYAPPSFETYGNLSRDLAGSNKSTVISIQSRDQSDSLEDLENIVGEEDREARLVEGCSDDLISGGQYDQLNAAALKRQLPQAPPVSPIVLHQSSTSSEVDSGCASFEKESSKVQEEEESALVPNFVWVGLNDKKKKNPKLKDSPPATTSASGVTRRPRNHDRLASIAGGKRHSAPPGSLDHFKQSSASKTSGSKKSSSFATPPPPAPGGKSGSKSNDFLLHSLQEILYAIEKNEWVHGRRKCIVH